MYGGHNATKKEPVGFRDKSTLLAGRQNPVGRQSPERVHVAEEEEKIFSKI
jgi:hypothetical protein